VKESVVGDSIAASAISTSSVSTEVIGEPYATDATQLAATAAAGQIGEPHRNLPASIVL